MANTMTINPIGTLYQYTQWDEFEGFVRLPLATIREYEGLAVGRC